MKLDYENPQMQIWELDDGTYLERRAEMMTGWAYCPVESVTSVIESFEITAARIAIAAIHKNGGERIFGTATITYRRDPERVTLLGPVGNEVGEVGVFFKVYADVPYFPYSPQLDVAAEADLA